MGKAMSGIWKLEFQERGAAHYHLLLCGLQADDLHKFREWTSLRWFEIVDSGDEKHLRAGTEVEPAKTPNGAMCYLAKYVSKDDQTRPGNFTGRYWGCVGKSSLPLAEVIHGEMLGPAMVKVQRWARKLIRANMDGTRWKNFLASRKGKRHIGMFGASRQDWDRLRSAHHGGAQQLTYASSEGSGWISTKAVQFTYQMGLRPPSKWRVRNHTTVRLLCDASSFLASLERAMEAGLL